MNDRQHKCEMISIERFVDCAVPLQKAVKMPFAVKCSTGSSQFVPYAADCIYMHSVAYQSRVY